MDRNGRNNVEFLFNLTTPWLPYGAVLWAFYLFGEPLLTLFGYDFGRANVSIVHFTRNDNSVGKKSDTLIFRNIDYRLPLRALVGKRYLAWIIMIVGFSATLDRPVLRFGIFAPYVLKPFRGLLNKKFANSFVKRVGGYKFVDTKYQIAIVFDREKGKTSYVLRVLVIREIDLVKFQKYLDSPPKVESNFELLKKVKIAFDENPKNFLKAMITAA